MRTRRNTKIRNKPAQRSLICELICNLHIVDFLSIDQQANFRVRDLKKCEAPSARSIATSFSAGKFSEDANDQVCRSWRLVSSHNA